MYHSRLVFWTAAIRPDCIREWQKLAPLWRFEHEFRVLSDLSQISPSRNQIVIFHASSHFRPQEVRKAVGESGTCILCAEDFSCFSEEELSAVDDFWRGDEPAGLARLRFEKLQKKLKADKDAWLCRNYLEQTIDTLPDLIWFKDLKGLHWKVNDAFCNTVDKTKEDIAGKDHYYIWGISREEYEKTEFVCVETEEEVLRARKTCLFDEKVMGKDGLRKLKTWKTPIFEEDGSIIGTVGIARDVTQEYEYQQTIIKMAHYDALTGLANRHYMQKYIESHWLGRELAVVVLDLDFFKSVNDTYGHQVGDAALMIFSAAMKEIFTSGLNVRLGGDEFVAIALLDKGRAYVEKKVKRFLEQLVAYYRMDHQLHTLSASAGIAFSETSSDCFEALLQHADVALYHAKLSGRGRYSIYNPGMKTEDIIEEDA